MPEGFSFGGPVDRGGRPNGGTADPTDAPLWRYEGWLPGWAGRHDRGRRAELCGDLREPVARLSEEQCRMDGHGRVAARVGHRRLRPCDMDAAGLRGVGPDRHVSQRGRPADRACGRAAARDRRSSRARCELVAPPRLSLGEARCSASVAARPGCCSHGGSGWAAGGGPAGYPARGRDPDRCRGPRHHGGRDAVQRVRLRRGTARGTWRDISARLRASPDHGGSTAISRGPSPSRSVRARPRSSCWRCC